MPKSIDLILFYADWCGHCKSFKPEWKKLEDTIKEMDNKIKESVISLKSYEDSVIPQGLATINGKEIRGYPTVKITVTDNGKKTEYEYNGQRTSQAVLEKIKQLVK